jgi:uncharacterized damage-inducible protein DinB
MFQSQRDVIRYALQSSLAMVRRLVEDLTPDELNAQPIAGLNSIAWILGHLTVVDRRQLEALGMPLPPVPDDFATKFSPTRVAATAQSGLGDPAQLAQQFVQTRQLLIVAVDDCTEESLKAATPPHAFFSTREEALVFMATHTGLHTGQVSAIRRALGKPPLV